MSTLTSFICVRNRNKLITKDKRKAELFPSLSLLTISIIVIMICFNVFLHILIQAELPFHKKVALLDPLVFTLFPLKIIHRIPRTPQNFFSMLHPSRRCMEQMGRVSVSWRIVEIIVPPAGMCCVATAENSWGQKMIRRPLLGRK